MTGHEVVIAVQRAARPLDLPRIRDLPQLTSCPFCGGHENETTPAVAYYPPPPGVTPRGEWQVRVVPNMYPAFVPDVSGFSQCHKPGEPVASLGMHEVVIESPRHLRRLTELQPAEVALALRAYRDRLSTFAADERMACGIVFKNCGREAGMSREHIHSQLAAFPFVPPILQAELAGARRFLERQGQCVFCWMIAVEQAQGIRVVGESGSFLAFCPYASRVAYETWVLPKRHQACFERATDALLAELAELLHDILSRLELRLHQPAYNYLIHTSPFDTRSKDHYHWHIEIIPRIAKLAGLEWGTGVHVNIVTPEAAAQTLRETVKA